MNSNGYDRNASCFILLTKFLIAKIVFHFKPQAQTITPNLPTLYKGVSFDRRHTPMLFFMDRGKVNHIGKGLYAIHLSNKGYENTSFSVETKHMKVSPQYLGYSWKNILLPLDCLFHLFVHLLVVVNDTEYESVTLFPIL